MALQQIDSHQFLFDEPPLGVHEHMRLFDGVTHDLDNPEVPEIDEGRVGKAGVGVFSEVALQSGFPAMLTMPNESLRLPGLSEKELEEAGGVDNPNRTHLVPYPLSNRDRLLAAANVIGQRSNIPVGLIVGVDPLDLSPEAAKIEIDHDRASDRARARKLVEPVIENFAHTSDLVMAAKGFANMSTGGFMINPHLMPYIIEGFHETNPGKPFINHIEGDLVRGLFQVVMKLGGKDWDIHIAHVSSEKEMDAVIYAQELLMNVTCEVTLHHLFLTDEHSQRPDGLGCMVPSLKTQKDVNYLRQNFKRNITMIGNDCAPHAYSEKRQGTFGITNHPSVLNRFMDAALDPDQEWIDLEDVDEKLCVATYDRFNFPRLGGQVVFDTTVRPQPNTKYAATDPFVSAGAPPGGVVYADTGMGTSIFDRTGRGGSVLVGHHTYRHFIKPR